MRRSSPTQLPSQPYSNTNLFRTHPHQSPVAPFNRLPHTALEAVKQGSRQACEADPYAEAETDPGGIALLVGDVLIPGFLWGASLGGIGVVLAPFGLIFLGILMILASLIDTKGKRARGG